MQFISMTSPNVSALIICVHLNHFSVKNPDVKVFQIWVVSLSPLCEIITVHLFLLGDWLFG